MLLFFNVAHFLHEKWGPLFSKMRQRRLNQPKPDLPIPPDIVCLDDYERHARALLPADIQAYIGGGAADMTTLRDNRDAFARLRLLPRVLGNLRDASAAASLFGLTLETPVIAAPMAWQKLVHPEGEFAMATGAAAAGAGCIASCQASVDMTELARNSPAPLWFQLYLQPRRDDTLALVQRAGDAGYRALVVTVDAPVNGVRNAEQRAGFHLPAHVRSVNLAGFAQAAATRAGPARSPVFRGLVDAAPGWDDIAWLREQTRLPLLLKGVTHPDDAGRALDLGVDGLIVSNHGGRVLDGVPAAIDLLPAVARRVDGRIPVLMDGGVRRGTDVLKALALGARAVLVGRPLYWALATAGAAGVAHALAILATELEAAMALTGRPALAAIDASVLARPHGQGAATFLPETGSPGAGSRLDLEPREH